MSWWKELRYMAEKIVQRIDGIIKHIVYIQNEIAGISFDDFMRQHLLPEAICFSISQVGEKMNKLEELVGNKYPDIPWKSARKMRNIIVHNYDGVNFEEVYLTAINDLPILKKQLLDIKGDIKQINKNSLTSERLTIRPWDDFDADELFELAQEPEIGYWCGWEPHKHIRDTFFALHNFLEIEETYAICLKDNNIIIGSIGLHFKNNIDLTYKDDEAELGYWIGKPYWNNGYATEAGKAIIKHAFKDLKLSRVWCGYYEGNEQSKRVQEKLGFKFHHRSESAEVPQLNTTRIGYVSCLSKDEYNY